jgi:hypothetical protein
MLNSIPKGGSNENCYASAKTGNSAIDGTLDVTLHGIGKAALCP